MTSTFPNTPIVKYFLHTGAAFSGACRSMFACRAYGVGTECQEPAGFRRAQRRIDSPRRGSTFPQRVLAATFRVSIVKFAADAPLANIRPQEAQAPLAGRTSWRCWALTPLRRERLGAVDQLESAIANYETVFRMRWPCPSCRFWRRDGGRARVVLGRGENAPRHFLSTAVLVARRLGGIAACVSIERTARGGLATGWIARQSSRRGTRTTPGAVDQHRRPRLADLYHAASRPYALGLGRRSAARHLPKSWADGSQSVRVHGPVWPRGIKGSRHGLPMNTATSRANKVEMHDLHATLLHCGVDHPSSIPFRRPRHAA